MNSTDDCITTSIKPTTTMSKLPRLACFHGGGSNKEIFEVQCSQLENLLKSEFEFHFFDGPFIRDAGPGVLPAFEGYEPFHNWFKVADDGTYLLSDGSGYDESGRDGIARVKTLMKERGGEWVGAIGFSQGTRVVAGLLLDQQRSIEQGKSEESGFDLKFGVLCNGGNKPMGMFYSTVVSFHSRDMLIVVGQPRYPRIHRKNEFGFQLYMSTVCEISSCSLEENSTRRISIPQRRHFTRLIITTPCPGRQRKSKRWQKKLETLTEAPEIPSFDHRRNLIDFITCSSSFTLT